MSDITVQDVMEWMGKASAEDLTQVADDLIERDFAASQDDVDALQQEIAHYEHDEDERAGGLLQEAAARLRRRDYREALHVLANALGPDFDLLETVPLGAA